MIVYGPRLVKSRTLMKMGFVVGGFGQGCHLLEVADSFGSLSAQKRNESRMHTGFSFLDCRVDGQGLQIYLGRAWGNFSRTVYSYTYLNDIIYPGGWSDFGFPQRDQ